MRRIVDVCSVSQRGEWAGEMLRWATNRRGMYILHSMVTSTGRKLTWEETKHTINQVLIRDRGDALALLLTGRFATRLRGASQRSPSLIAAEHLLLELDNGRIVSLTEAGAAADSTQTRLRPAYKGRRQPTR